MLHLIPARLRHVRDRLGCLDDQPLSRAALIVIVFLDLFILTAIFDGLADHTAQLVAPDERVPPLCQSLVIDSRWNAANRLDALADRVRADRHNDYEERAVRKSGGQHPLCAPIVAAYEAIRADGRMYENLQQSQLLRRETQDLRGELARIKGAYDTALLEKIAGEAPVDKDTAAIAKTVAENTAALNELVGKQALLDASLEQDARVRELFTRVAAVSDNDRRTLAEDLRQLNFWYPAQRLGMQMLFLLPLVAAFYFWNAKSITRHRPFQTLVSSHLLIVVMIPVFFKLIELVYDIIPRKLLRQLIELLESLKLVAIWHYLLIAGAIVVALGIVYLFQKKLFSREKLLRRRIAKGQCQACGEQLVPGSAHCTVCGAAQMRACVQCGEATPLHGRYCRVCGAAQAAG